MVGGRTLATTSQYPTTTNPHPQLQIKKAYPPHPHQETGGKYVSMIVCIMTYPPTLLPL